MEKKLAKFGRKVLDTHDHAHRLLKETKGKKTPKPKAKK